MNDQEREAVRAMLRRRSAERTGTREEARQWLISEGLYEDDGRLKPVYGGPTEPEQR